MPWFICKNAPKEVWNTNTHHYHNVSVRGVARLSDAKAALERLPTVWIHCFRVDAVRLHVSIIQMHSDLHGCCRVIDFIKPSTCEMQRDRLVHPLMVLWLVPHEQRKAVSPSHREQTVTGHTNKENNHCQPQLSRVNRHWPHALLESCCAPKNLACAMREPRVSQPIDGIICGTLSPAPYQGARSIITETNRIHLVIFGKQHRTWVPIWQPVIRSFFP
jgi:hypothetical protein